MLKNIFYSSSRILFIFNALYAVLFKKEAVFKKIEHGSCSIRSAVSFLLFLRHKTFFVVFHPILRLTCVILKPMTKKETDFERMVREHKSTVYTVCYMFSKDTDEVNDLFQEVLINLWKGFDSFRGESKVDTWIWRIALNTCISDDRKKKRRGERVPLEMAADLYTDTDEDTKQIRQLYARINKLGIMDRALVLLWLENLSYEEIGAIAGISAKNVSVKLVRIKQQLMKMSDNQEC